MPFKGYRQTSSYGYRTHPVSGARQSFHAGIDLVKSHKAVIHAFTAGTVVYAGFGKKGSGLGGYGNVVLIKDAKGYGQLYAHLDSVNVKTGQKVAKGQAIGRQGATGVVTGSHLHFEVRKKTSPSYGWTSNKAASTVDPTNYLRNYKHGASLSVDGKWGKGTTRALQKALGTTADGIISRQPRNSVTTALYGGTVSFGSGNGSPMVSALQRKIGAKADGKLGPETVRKLQAYLGTVQDGKLSRPSLVVKELQRRLNNGSF